MKNDSYFFFFKYSLIVISRSDLGVNVNNKNNMHQEINERIMYGNRCYYSIVKLLKSK